jgi:hypothetical protein
MMNVCYTDYVFTVSPVYHQSVEDWLIAICPPEVDKSNRWRRHRRLLQTLADWPGDTPTRAIIAVGGCGVTLRDALACFPRTGTKGATFTTKSPHVLAEIEKRAREGERILRYVQDYRGLPRNGFRRILLLRGAAYDGPAEHVAQHVAYLIAHYQERPRDGQNSSHAAQEACQEKY